MPKNIYCKNCVHLRNDWCQKAVDSPDPDMERDCYYSKASTNADRIRAMSDDELAEFLAGLGPCCHCLAVPEERNQVIHPHDCCEKWLNWVKKEVSE